MNFIEKMKIEKEEKFKKLLTKYYIPERYKDAGKVYPGKSGKDLAKEYNKIYDRMQLTVPKEVGEKIAKEFNDDEYLLGIHRTDKLPDQVFNGGIKMRGTEFTSNVQISGYLPFILEQIKACENYKGSRGCYIVKIPKNKDLPIYFKDGEDLYLLPEYIVGYVPVENEELISFISNPEYREKHNYSSIGLEYDTENLDHLNTRKSK